jgi:uncharacterized damage-inducible protein DinB
MRQGIMCVVAVAALAGTAASYAQGRGGAQACTTVACDLQADWDRNKGLISGIANAMPDDKYSYKSTPAQRSFAEQVMHVASIDVALLSTMGAKTPAPKLNEKAATKAEVMAELQKSQDYGTAVLKEFTDAQLMERVKSLPFMGPTVSRIRLAYFSISHGQDIYGQMAVYLRLNGIVPPASNRGGV